MTTHPQKMRNVADEKSVQDGAESALRGRERALNDVRAIISTRGGRRVLYRYIEQCGVFKCGYYGNKDEAVFNEGLRKIGLEILRDVEEAQSDAIVLMKREAKEELNG